MNLEGKTFKEVLNIKPKHGDLIMFSDYRAIDNYILYKEKRKKIVEGKPVKVKFQLVSKLN